MAMGRPVIEIDWEQVEKMAHIQCTQKEICNILGISEDTILRRCQEKYGITFAEYLDQKSAGGKMSLRRKQYTTAMAGNVTMLIWLGKQYLAQKDKLDQDVTTDGKPVQIIYQNENSTSSPSVAVPNKPE